MYKHIKISSTNYVNGLMNGRSYHTIISYRLYDNNLCLKVQKGRLTVNALYFFVCELLRTNEEARKALNWIPMNKMRGTYVKERFSGACDHFITYKDDWYFVNKKFIIHTTANNYIESEFGNRNEIRVFLPDLLLLMINNDFQTFGNDMIVRAIKGELLDSNTYVDSFETNGNDKGETKYTYDEISKEEQDYNLEYIVDLAEYVKNIPTEPAEEEKAEEVVGE